MTADQIARDLRQEAAKLLTIARILEGESKPKRPSMQQRGPTIRRLAREGLAAQKRAVRRAE